MPVLVLAGDEDFEISRKVKDLKSKLLDPSWASVNFQRLDNPSLQEISDAAQTIPFGPGNRVVLIDRCELFTKKRGKAGAASSAKASAKSSAKATKDKEGIEPEDFEKSLSGVHPNTHLIFSCPFNFDSTLKISKAISKVAKVEAFPKEKYWPGSHNAKLHSWCQREAKQYSATIDDEAIQYLLDSTDANLRQISSELAKAAVAALPGTHINYALIVELSPHHSNVFELADKWISGETAEALISLHELLREQSGIPVLATLQTLLGKWIRMKVLCDKINSELPGGAGVKRKELPLPELTRRVASELKLVPFIVERDLRKIARIPTEQLMIKRDELTRLEHLLKTGQVPEKHALELFAVTSPQQSKPH